MGQAAAMDQAAAMGHAAAMGQAAAALRGPQRFRSRSRDGCTRFGSPGIFG
jgi:hypothetical protein